MTVIILLAILVIAGYFAASALSGSHSGWSAYRQSGLGQTASAIRWAGVSLAGSVALLFAAMFIGGSLALIGGGLFALGKGLRSLKEARGDAADAKGFRQAYFQDIAPWWKRLFGFRDFFFMDWDRLFPAAGRVRISPFGGVQEEAIHYGASTADQTAINRENMRARQAAAGKRAPSKFEVLDSAGLLPYALPKAGQKALGLGQPDPATQQNALPAPADTGDRKPPSLIGGIRKVSRPDLFVLGYRYDGLGQLTPAMWDTYADSVLVILGKSRRGKTSSVGITIGLQMLWHGWQTVILDPEREQTWSVLAPWAEHRRTDADNVVGYVDAYVDEWQRRGELLQAHGASDLRDLPDAVRPPHAALIVEEYDKLRREVLRYHGDDALNKMDAGIADIAQVGAKRLMRLVIVNQYNSSKNLPWPDAIRQQGKKLTFTQEVNDYSLVGYHDLMGLGVGEFAFEGQRWQGFHAEPIAAKVMAKAPARRSRPPALLPPVPAPGTSLTGGRNNVPAVPAPPPPPDKYGWVGGDTGNVPAGNEAPPPAQPGLLSNEETARNWLARHADSDLPRGWSTQLAQALAANNNDGDNWQSYKSEAARWKERYHPSGSEYTDYIPPDGWPKPHGWPPEPEDEGDRFQTDPTGWVGLERPLSRDEWIESVNRLPQKRRRE